jgi:cyclophilin family peptidyl-prolyl cis-trans isomerase/HEAT repeat protein
VSANRSTIMHKTRQRLLEVCTNNIGLKLHTGIILSALVAALLLPAAAWAQLPPTTPPRARPSLRRDRTQRVLFPKIIQAEDERTDSQDLRNLISNHPSSSVRRRAILALGRIGVGVAELAEVLNNEKNPRLRALAAFSLGLTGNEFGVAALLEHLQPKVEPSAEVRARAAEALGRIASNKRAADSLGQYGIKGITEAIVGLLPPASPAPSAEDAEIASKALTALLRLKQPDSVGAVARQLKSPDARLRWQAANALARIREGVTIAVGSLLPLLGDSEPLVRAHAARALGVAKAGSAVEPLLRLLRDHDERVVASAIVALGSIADPKATDPLVALGSSLLSGYKAFNTDRGGVPTEKNLLMLTATALGEIKDARALPLLKTMRLMDGRLGPNPEVEVAMAAFGEAAFFDLPDRVRFSKEDWRAAAAFAQGLGKLGADRARQTLLDLLSGSYGKPDPRAVPDILSALAEAKAPGLTDLLLGQLKAEDVIVRTTAANLLGEAGDSSDQIISALKEAYKSDRNDTMNDARIAVIEALNKLKHPMNVEVLSDPTRDPDYVVRLKAAELLANSGTDAAGLRVKVDKVATGHDRAYWRAISELSISTKNPIAVIHTRKGSIRIELFAQDAPMTVDNFMKLARGRFYDGLTFMRVVPNFVIQGGDPRDDQNGGPGYQIRDEINLHEYGTGTVGMALSGKDTGGSQFFITHSPQPHLDGGYTVFGQVIEGMDVVNRIARGDRIDRIEILENRD